MQKKQKSICQWKDEIKCYHLPHVFFYFVNAAPSKIYSEKKITAFFSDFAQFKLKKGLIFGI